MRTAGLARPERLVELGAQQLIDALDHIVHDLGGRVPDAEVFAQLGIEGFQKGLVKIRHGLVFRRYRRRRGGHG